MSARALAKVHKISANLDSQQALYQALNTAGFYWNSKAKGWDDHRNTPINPPTSVIRIRVWADGQIVGQIASSIAEFLKTHGLQMLNQTEAFPCRPPSQKESRIYLEFSSGQADTDTAQLAPRPGDMVLGSPHR